MLKNMNNSENDKRYYAYLSITYFSLKDYENSIKYARLHIESGLQISTLESNVYKTLIDSLICINESREVIEKEIINAINKFPQSPNFYYLYADFLLDAKKYKKALENLFLSLKYSEDYNGTDINLVSGVKDKIYAEIAQIYEFENNNSCALEYYFKSLMILKHEENTFVSMCRLLKNQKCEDIIVALNQIYDINNISDLKFLSYNLIQTNLIQVYNYYAVRYLKENDDIKIKIYLLIFNNKYNQVFEELYKLYESMYSSDIAVLLVVTALLTNEDKYKQRLINKIRPSLSRILKVYFEKENNIKLINEEIDDYIHAFEFIINIGEVDVIKKYLELEKNFEENENINVKIVKSLLA